VNRNSPHPMETATPMQTFLQKEMLFKSLNGYFYAL